MIRTLTILLSSLLCSSLFAKPGDTTRITTHNKVVIKTNPAVGNTKYYGWGVFPKAGTKYQKAYAELTFKCAPGLRCGEWDYLNYIYLCNRRGSINDSLGWEIMRFITPYGFYWDQNWNHTWVFDITDFAHLLHDSIQIMYQHTGYEGNADRGWQISLSFNMVEGTPWRDVKNITRFYTKSVGYGNDTMFDKNVPEVNFTLGAETDLMRFKVLQTGHGMDKPENCAEFCPKRRRMIVDGALADEKWVWRADCGENPVFPQAGTWLYDRTDWCPGAEVREYNLDIPCTPGTQHSMDLDMESYSTTSGGANYMLSSYLVEYGKTNFQTDVSIEDIIAPSDQIRYKRVNPYCGQPQIVVRNNGAQPIEAIDFLYGTPGLKNKHHRWTGNLKSGQLDTIHLPTGYELGDNPKKFGVKAVWVNYQPDDYQLNNYTESNIGALPPTLPNQFLIYCRTNNAPSENSFEIRDADGKTVKRRTVYPKAATMYFDTITLPEGCYTFDFQDTGRPNPAYQLNKDGLEWWANTADGAGILQFRNLTNTAILQRFGSDFGSSIRLAFRVGNPSATPTTEQLSVWPIPANDALMIDLSTFSPDKLKGQVNFTIYDMRGRLVLDKQKSGTLQPLETLYIRDLADGTYVLKVTLNGTTTSHRIVKQ